MLKKLIFFLLCSMILSSCSDKQTMEIKNINTSNEKIVIAHRGASGYLPEHSIAAKAMAHAMNADYIEQDVVMTKDDQLVVLHDHYLDRVTNVMDVFPDRFRMEKDQKRWFVIDFTLDEIKQLEMTEGFDIDAETGELKQNYPNRFPMKKSTFRVVTLSEEIELIQGLNQSTGKDIGIYVEIKSPWFHRFEGKDITTAVLQTLKQYGYQNKSDKVFLQCFDANELFKIKNEIMPALDMDLKLVQLIAMNDWDETMTIDGDKLIPYDYHWMFESGAMEKISEYADGIGPWFPMLVDVESQPDDLKISHMVKEAHQAGMVVHPYTFRTDEGHIPPFAKDFNDMLDIYFNQVGVDGVFTDYPDLAVEFLGK
ncbi:MAG: glycerophosphodiester phosphodiesterase [Gammaproteobacteria bacterium]|nr:glycerophosphodiester phosphodiesterase [Gammaproteobacteria bacterium]